MTEMFAKLRFMANRSLNSFVKGAPGPFTYAGTQAASRQNI